jgi:hypothetical protein
VVDEEWITIRGNRGRLATEAMEERVLFADGTGGHGTEETIEGDETR